MDRAQIEWLFKRYPGLFAQKNLPPGGPLLGIGIACGPGWLGLLDSLCRTLTDVIEWDDMPPIQILQIKEKLGRLRFRYRGGNDATRLIVELAANLSEEINQDNGSWRNEVHWP